MKPLAHQFRPQENLFLGMFRLPKFTYIRAKRLDNLGKRLMVASNFKKNVGYGIFQSEVVSQSLATISV